MTLNYTHSGTQIINSDTQLHTQWHSATHTVTLNNTHSNTQLHTQWHSTTHMVTLNYKQWHSTIHTVALNTSYTATLSSTHSDAMTQTLLSYVPLGPVIHTLPLQLPWWIFCIFFSDLKPWRAVCQYSDLGESVLEYDVLTQWYANIFANIRKNLKICIMANSLFFQETLKQNVQPD